MAMYDVAFYGQTAPFNSVLYSTFGWAQFSVDSDVITDFDTRAQKLLLEQFRYKPNIDAILQSYIDPFQELEYKIYEVQILTLLQNATGIQLDNIAEYVGLLRNGLDDNEYRQAIRTKIILNRSNGDLETVITGVKFITGDEFCRVVETYPAKLTIVISGPVPNQFTKQAILSIMVAGVGLTLLYKPVNLKLLGFKQENGIPPPFIGQLKENNYDSSATDGYLAELIN